LILRALKLIFYLFCFNFQLIFAQSSCKDSLIQKLQSDSLRIYKLKKILPHFSIDDRITRISGERSDISGFKIGLNLVEKYVFGVGIYSLLNGEKKFYSPYKPDSMQIFMRMNYLTLFYHHVILRKKHVEFQIPVEFGLGNVIFKKVNYSNNKITDEKTYPILPSGFGFKAIIKPIPHFGLFIFLGYRWVESFRKLPLNLNGAFSSVGLHINLLKITRDVRYHGFKKTRFKKNLKICKE
jgi:hypothetical protein